jgi:hypothetical protein
VKKLPRGISMSRPALMEGAVEWQAPQSGSKIDYHGRYERTNENGMMNLHPSRQTGQARQPQRDHSSHVRTARARQTHSPDTTNPEKLYHVLSTDLSVSGCSHAHLPLIRLYAHM